MKIKKYPIRLLVIILPMLLFIACQNKKEAPKVVAPTAQEIVDRAITTMGGSILENAQIKFKFRDYYYTAQRTNNTRILDRCTDAACVTQLDRIELNGDFIRFRESVRVPVPDSMKTKFISAINSVHYFSVLPFGLNDGAVTKTVLDEHTVKGKPYYRVKVTFSEDGGGEDYQDQYLYWIHKEEFTVDYLAYNYQVDGGGTRFREAYNKRTINGVTFADYRNYKAATKFPPLTTLDTLFEAGSLKLLSTIALEEITVNPIIN